MLGDLGEQSRGSEGTQSSGGPVTSIGRTLSYRLVMLTEDSEERSPLDRAGMGASDLGAVLGVPCYRWEGGMAWDKK